MSTQNAGIKNDYYAESDVSASDLNRRADILDTQAYGALLGVGVGVIENATNTSLKVTGAGGVASVAAGEAIVFHADDGDVAEHPVKGYLGESAPFSLTVSADEPYVHAVLIIGEDLGDPETELGTAEFEIIASADEEVPNALLIGERNSDGTFKDRRTFTKPDRALALIAQIIADLGYDATARLKGTVNARLNTLESGSGGGEGEGGPSLTLISQLGFNAEDTRAADIVIKELIAAAVEAALATIVPGQKATRQPLDFIVHEQAIQRGEVAILQETVRTLQDEDQLEASGEAGLTVRARVVERSQSLTIGPGFGSGENSSPDFDDVGPTKNTDGSFGVAI